MSVRIIDDGYTREATVEGLTVEYRPLTFAEWRRLMNWSDKLEGDAGTARIAHEIAKHIVEWDAVDGEGVTADVSGENVQKLPPPVGQALQLELASFTKQETDEKNSDPA